MGLILLGRIFWPESLDWKMSAPAQLVRRHNTIAINYCYQNGAVRRGVLLHVSNLATVQQL